MGGGVLGKGRRRGRFVWKQQSEWDIFTLILAPYCGRKKSLSTRENQHPQGRDRSQSRKVKNIQRTGSEYNKFCYGLGAFLRAQEKCFESPKGMRNGL